MQELTFHGNHRRLLGRARSFAPFDAEDLAQEVYLRLLKAGVAQPWAPGLLFQTLEWVIIDRYRKVRSRQSVRLFDQPSHPRIVDSIFVRQLLEADPHGDIVHRSVIGGWPPAEIAAEDGVNVNTTAVRKHRALQRMRAAALGA